MWISTLEWILIGAFCGYDFILQIGLVILGLLFIEYLIKKIRKYIKKA